MAPRSVLDTWDWTATSAKRFGRYLRASARDIARREYPRSYGATLDTACRCYLRGPDGVSGLAPSGTWGTLNIPLEQRIEDCGLTTEDCGPTAIADRRLTADWGTNCDCGLTAEDCEPTQKGPAISDGAFIT